jgi:hypothetical protein
LSIFDLHCMYVFRFFVIDEKVFLPPVFEQALQTLNAIRHANCYFISAASTWKWEKNPNFFEGKQILQRKRL